MTSNNLASAIMNAETRTETCADHGEYESRHILFGETDIWSKCPTCSEEKANRDRAEEMAEARRQAAAGRIQSMLGYACLPPRFAGKTFATYRAERPEQERVLRICREYADDFPAALRAGTNLVMLGMPGTGKTHLAVAILNDVITRHGMTGVYTSASRMFRRIKDTYGNNEESEMDAIGIYTKPSLLVLDEIGISFGSDVEMNYLFDVMNERYEQCLPTIIVSNIQPEEMGTWLGDRVVDRLRESSRMMLFNWESARKTLARESFE